MKKNKKQFKKNTCEYCKKTSEVVGVIQKETHYYSLNLDTNQTKDFHGDESVELQEFFCLECKNIVNVKRD